ncbi:hypothetical protein PC115_g6727 [Phytophthora cactorum]|uniref:Uncharacterized protein n=2 Tax=Phytophthora cactorum TaxID=29920 RepID=A0A8T1CRJ5_9STRA|nr:hypothetical protein PC115_g6727 [Phytophthora cactorum]KAG3091265.1 hypothetical protein PC122_g7084 [Phytophthora cactorum]
MPLLFQTIYICSDGDNNAKCSTRDELITALENKFKWQLEYTSPNDDHRVRKDHFYVYTIEDTDYGVSIDIFNVDSGDAGIHAAPQFTEWSDDSRMPKAEKVQTCNDTREIVNNHYSSVVLPIGVLVVSVVAVTMLLLFQTTRVVTVMLPIGVLVASVVTVTRLLSFQYAKDEVKQTKYEVKTTEFRSDPIYKAPTQAEGENAKSAKQSRREHRASMAVAAKENADRRGQDIPDEEAPPSKRKRSEQSAMV